MATCRIGNCDRKIFSQCLCRSHYKSIFTQCVVGSCTQTIFCKFLCRYHYDRCNQETLSQINFKCVLCDKKMYMNSLCYKHYREKKFRIKCIYPNCNSTEIFCKHYCNKHYQKVHRRQKKSKQQCPKINSST